MAPVGSSFFTVPPLVPRGPEPEVMVVWLVGGARPTTPESASPEHRPAGGGHMTKASVSGGSVT
ncbi:MAG: hypothetical protein ABSE77_21045 [Acidimicrobiales bacterium]|jgi:hypothetical protein